MQAGLPTPVEAGRGREGDRAVQRPVQRQLLTTIVTAAVAVLTHIIVAILVLVLSAGFAGSATAAAADGAAKPRGLWRLPGQHICEMNKMEKRREKEGNETRRDRSLGGGG